MVLRIATLGAAMMAHGECTGVDVTPVVKPRSGCGAFILCVLVFMVVLGLAGKAGSPGAFPYRTVSFQQFPQV